MFRLRDSLEVIGLKLWVDYACWLYCDVFPRWRGVVVLRKLASRVQSAVTDLAIRGATRQWLKKAKAAAWSDFVQWSRWNSVMMQWGEMTDILAKSGRT